MTTRLLATLTALTSLALSAGAAEDGRFESMGIGGGGQMYGVGISPHDSKLIHVSCDMGTFYLTENGGRTWHMIDQLQMVGIRSCRPAYHPKDPEVVYMPYYRNASQLRVSRDGGWHWEVLCDNVPWGQPKGRDKYDEFVTAIDLDPDDGDLMFVSTPKGLWRSTDGGKSFAQCQGLGGMAIAVHVSPASPRNSRLCVAATSEGVYISNDSGKSWQKKGSGLPGGMFGFAAVTDRKTKTVNCYATYDGSVWRSGDSGENFTKCAGLPKAKYRFASLAQTHPKTAYVSDFASNYGVWKTTDRGATWKKVFGPRLDGNRWGWLGIDWTRGFGGRANCITVAPSDPNEVVFVNTGEMFITTDGGKTWEERCSDYKGPDQQNRQKGQAWAGIGLEVALPTNMIWDSFVKDRVYLIYGDIGFLISTDRGKSWRRSVKGIPRGWVNRMWELVPDPDNKGVFYAACSGQHGSVHDTSTIRHSGGVVMTTDHGESWKVISTGLPKGKVPCTGLTLDTKSPKNSRVLYCVMQNDGVYKTTDGGKSWSKKSTGLGKHDNKNIEQVRMGPEGGVYCLMIGKSRNWRFDYSGGAIFKSTDGAGTWTDITKGINVGYPKEFAVDPRDAKHIYLATTQAPRRESAGLWETKDGGATWKKVLSRDDMGGKALYSFVHSGQVIFHPTDPRYVYYSTKTHGIQITRDGGRSWTRMLGVPRLASGMIVFDPDDRDVIYVCSVGLWKGPAEGYGPGAKRARKKAKASTPVPVAAASKPARGASQQRAGKLYRDGRTAERAGMKDLARTFYKRLVDEFPATEFAEKAKTRLEKL